MKLKKIIKYLQEALDNNDATTKAALKSLVLKLKKKEGKLKEKLAQTTNEQDISDIKAKLEINRTHRKKGIEALAALKDEK